MNVKKIKLRHDNAEITTDYSEKEADELFNELFVKKESIEYPNDSLYERRIVGIARKPTC